MVMTMDMRMHVCEHASQHVYTCVYQNGIHQCVTVSLNTTTHMYIAKDAYINVYAAMRMNANMSVDMFCM